MTAWIDTILSLQTGVTHLIELVHVVRLQRDLCVVLIHLHSESVCNPLHDQILANRLQLVQHISAHDHHNKCTLCVPHLLPNTLQALQCPFQHFFRTNFVFIWLGGESEVRLFQSSTATDDGLTGLVMGRKRRGSGRSCKAHSPFPYLLFCLMYSSSKHGLLAALLDDD